MMNDFFISEQSRIDPLPSLYKFHTTADVLRLDLLHPVISGNKWFKLKEYLKDAQQLHKKRIITFGGAYSNHIVATAAAGKQSGLKSTGIIRGEEPPVLSQTLTDALSFGMELVFVCREDYKVKNIPAEIIDDDSYIINEGGYGVKGMNGAEAILQQTDLSAYTHIIAAVGTGTTLAGLINASEPHQKIIGIPVLKNNFSLQKEIEALLPKKKHQCITLIHDYHFSGYAKYNAELLQFMNDWYRQNKIPSDFVYTGKLFFALDDLIKKNYFPPQSKILAIHSGGLQGNRSLQKGTLIF
ncbi:MAG: 1-aminocyclopropane-1-carboxylate deaminase/D-cysteine desulfhydrase [Flavisolibacter sp.]